MPVNIRDNAEYRRIVKSLVRKNIESSDKDNGHIKGLFSFLAGWRVPVPMKDHD
jgi:hypothetical protein